MDHPVDADVPQLVVTDTGKALLQLAGWYRRRFRLPVVGLTGSVGKTTTKEFIALVLGAKYNTLKTQQPEQRDWRASNAVPFGGQPHGGGH